MKYKNYYLLLIAVLVVTYLPSLYKLGNPTIRLWDEARLAVNAIEMAQNNQFLVTTFNKSPDLWNTKPPLAICLEAFSIKLFGINETAFRLPSALASILLCIFLAIFVYNQTQSISFAILTVIILAFSEGFTSEHAFRYGEYDALLTLFTTIYLLSFYRLCQKFTLIFILLFFAGIILAVLTKGIAGLLFMPSLFFYAVFTNKLKLLVSDSKIWIGTLISLFIILVYYFIREKCSVGYLKAVFENELMGRYFNTNEGHTGNWNFYLEIVNNSYFSSFISLLALSSIVYWLKINARCKKIVQFSLIISICFLITISISKTKLEWYLLPILPFLSILCTLPFVYLIEQINLCNYQLIYKKSIILVMFVLLFVPLFSKKQTYLNNLRENDRCENNEVLYFLREKLDNNQWKYKKCKIAMFSNPGVYGQNHQQFLVYKYKFEARNLKLELISTIDSIFVGDTILLSLNSNISNQFNNKYQFDTILTQNNIHIVSVIAKLP